MGNRNFKKTIKPVIAIEWNERSNLIFQAGSRDCFTFVRNDEHIKITFKLLIIIVLSSLLIPVFAQKNHYPKTNFRPPLDIPLIVAGNFGELRNNHFHMGLDFKTEGVEGKRIYSVEDGHVSRINVSHKGYGKCIYITHPNGFTSVYAHLQRFNEPIASFVKAAQMKEESFDIELLLSEKDLVVKKGDVIALSGNSGSSAAPHLHFEIRDTKTEHAINPLKFGYKISDKVSPTIKGVVIYPTNSNSMVNNAGREKTFSVKYNGNHQYSIGSKDIITVSGNIAFGIDGDDLLDAASNRCGLYSIELLIDNNVIYSHCLDDISFDESRYINSFVDYERLNTTGRRIQKSYLDPNNKLNIYKIVLNRGVYNFKDNQIHTIKYIVKDVEDNTSELEFSVQSINNWVPSSTGLLENFVQVFRYNQVNEFNANNFNVVTPLDAVYTDINFNYSASEPKQGYYSHVHHVHNDKTPIHKAITIGVVPTTEIPSRLKEKALIIRTDYQGNFKAAEGGIWEGNKLVATSKFFGNFRIAIDTISPYIKPISLGSTKKRSSNYLRFQISDGLSGIKSYKGYINNKWVVFDYDSKYSALTYVFDENCPKGENELKLVVTDKQDNQSTYKVRFVR